MKTLTIQIPNALNATLTATAAGRRQSKARVVRKLIEAGLSPAAEKKTASASIHDRLQKFQTAGPAGVNDLASNPAHMAGYGRD